MIRSWRLQSQLSRSCPSLFDSSSVLPCIENSRLFSDKPKKAQPKAKKSKAPAAQAETGRSKDLDLIVASLDAPVRKEGPISEEEQARRRQVHRNYIIGSFEQHNEIDHDLTCKIKLKKHALRMLPRNSKLKEEAMKIDGGEYPPPWRNIPTYTPPIPNFDPSLFVEKDEN